MGANRANRPINGRNRHVQPDSARLGRSWPSQRWGKAQRRAIPVLLALFLLVGCGAPRATEQATPAAALARELILYDWADDLSQSVLDAFSAETGVQVTYLTYETQEEAVANIQAGRIYDVAVIGNEYLPLLAGFLAPIDYRNIPNFDNISPSFRDLTYDPENRHSIPFNFATTVMLIRSDLVDRPIERWSDLWDEQFMGTIAVRESSPRDLIGAALKTLGYSFNTEDPTQLEAALLLLLRIRQRIILVDTSAEAAVPILERGEASVLIGYAEDILLAQERQVPIEFVLPQDGLFLWGDNFVIPATSAHKQTAELFLNFLLRPEISALQINQSGYATPNVPAQALVDAHILQNPAIFPTSADLVKAEIYLPLSDEGEALYHAIWQRFLGATSEAN